MKKKTYLLPAMVLLFVMVLAAVHAVAAISKDEDKKVIMEKAFKIRVPFIANEGQIKDNNVRFYANTFGGTVYVTKSGQIVYSLPKFDQKTGEEVKDKQIEQKPVKSIALKEEFVGENIRTEVNGEERAVTKVSYFKGNDSSRWKKDIPTYNLISLGEIYKGIELKLRAYGKNVEKLFYISPGAKPKDIRVKVKGSKSLKVNGNGELEIETELGTVKFTKPVAYQEIDGKRVEVAVNYSILNSKLRTSKPELTYGLAVGDYEKTKELVIDPLLSSTFLGGYHDDYASSIAIGSGGNIYVAGYTWASDFPTTPGAYDTSHNGGYDAFISKLSGNLTSLLSSTFWGGGNSDNSYSLTIGLGGDVYVAGYTDSSDFPTTPGAYDTSYNGGPDAFVSRLNGDLTTLLSSTFLGGNNEDSAYSIAIGSGGDIYVAGYTLSSDFPTIPGAYDTSYNGGPDAFVSRLNGDLTTLLSSTFLSSSNGQEVARSIAIGSGGDIYVAGDTLSSDFPTTPGAYDTSHNGYYDAFISKLNGDLTSLLSSTFLGGNSFDFAQTIAIGSGRDIYVAGTTEASDFPTTPGAYDTSHNGYYDAFISRLSGDLTSLLSSTFLGGSYDEYFSSIAIGSGGDIYVAGTTYYSSDFPTTPGAYDTSFNGGYDAFISRLSGDLTSLLSSTFLGGNNDDFADPLAIGSGGDIYVAGYTYSTAFPTSSNAYDTSHNGYRDSFISRLDSSLSEQPCAIGYIPTSFSFTATQGGSNPSNKTLSISNAGGGTLNWSVTDDATWLSLSPTSGTDDGTVTLSVNINGLIAGTYNDIVTITATGATNSPVNIPVTLRIKGPSSQWAMTYGGSGQDSTNSILQTSDGGYIVAGYTYSFGAGDYDAWILKLDSSGNVVWQKTYGGSNGDNASSIQQTSDGGYIVAGVTDSFGAGDYDAWILKLDAGGDVAWQKTYGGSSSDRAHSIQQTSDGGYIMAGFTDSFGTEYDTWALKLDAYGNVQWQKTYGGSGLYWGGSSIQQTSDGGYIMAGFTNLFGPGYPTDAWVLKLDTYGNVQWQKTYGGSDFDSASSIQQTSDGGYIMAGTIAVAGAGSSDAWISKLDSNGNIAWQKTYDKSIGSIQQTLDEGYIMAGSTYSGNYYDAWILKLDRNGKIPNCQIIGTSDAIVNNASATITNTAVTGINTSVSPQTSTASVINTNATATEVCYFESILLSPNGGEEIPSGSIYAIQWNATPGAVKFTLKYSINNGSTWKLIASNRTGTSYDWDVPTLSNNKKNCLVKVIGFNSSGTKVGEDISDSTFTIEVIKVISPDGGETLTSGSTHTITWRTNATIRPVAQARLSYSRNGGTSWTAIKTLTGNPETYNWTVPNVTSSTCKVKVVLKDSGGVTVGSDMSDANFIIQP